jgi:tetratricopeptide (TPR) repeat protein
LKTAYIAEQGRTKNLTKEADELSKALEEAEARMKDLQESQGITEQVKGKLEGKILKLETAMKVLQKAYIVEQVKTRKLTQKANELSRAVEQAKGRGKLPGQPPAQLKAMKQAQGPGKDVNQLADRLKEMEQVRAQVDALEESREAPEQEKGKEEGQAASEQEKGKLEANETKLEAVLENLQNAYDAEQAKTERFTDERADMIGLVIRLRSEMVTLHYTTGINYNNLGKNEEALKAFLMALKLNPNHAESHFELARLYMEHLGDKESAVAHFRRYLRLRPEANNAERIKGWLLRTETELRAKKDQRSWGTGSFWGKSKY